MCSFPQTTLYCYDYLSFIVHHVVMFANIIFLLQHNQDENKLKVQFYFIVLLFMVFLAEVRSKIVPSNASCEILMYLGTTTILAKLFILQKISKNRNLVFS